ncbi:MAG: right-handed parallel beta-helix repeat-containing protein [Verrucomicrobia bacterium]|nr:right-handed parallel beta-helix repeat-containing protein [Verrucomicrobiota bacterium]
MRLRNFTLYSLFPLTLLSASVFGDDSLVARSKPVRKETSYVTESEEFEPPWSEDTKCDLGSHSMQIGVRHSQGEGIGYHRGYTTLEGFLSPGHCVGGVAPFLDLRGHVFNNGKFAANTGLGLRYLTNSIAWGINSYYDYRNTHEFHYNQWGAGLEVIGSFWSINVNGYLPVGKKKSAFYDPLIEGVPTIPSFAFFQGNQMFITLSGSQGLAAKREFAFKGLDTKFVVRAIEKGLMAIDLGIGPYFYEGYYKKYAAGGEANITIRISDYLTVSGTGSYDNLFHLRGQGSIGISIPFGPRNFENCRKEQPCKIPKFFNSRLTRGSNRNEIVVVDTHRKILATATDGPVEVAINPATGAPYIFWFVDNTSHSDGTFESPFPTIQEALAVAQTDDAIYVYPGDNTPYDVDNITLLDGQYFLGSGFDQTVATTVGTITIPAQSTLSPNIENTMGGTMITVANQNVVSGFNLFVLNAGTTVVANAIDSLTFKNNTYSTTVTAGMNNIAFNDCFGTLLVQNNQFIMDPADTGSNGVNLSDAGSNASTLTLLNNTFSNHANRAITLNYSGTSTATLDFEGNSLSPAPGVAGTNGIDLFTSNGVILANSLVSQNTLSGYTGNGMNFGWGGTGGHNFTLSNNFISTDPTVVGTNGLFLTTNASGASSLTVSNNQFLNQTATGLQCNTSGSAFLQVAVSGNTVTGLATPGNNGLQFNPTDTSTITGSVTSNTCTEHLAADISGFPSSSGNLSLTVANNMLTGPSVVPGGSFPNGIQFSGNDSSTLFFNINHNTLNNHASQGINLFVNSTAVITLATIDSNTVIVPDLANTSGIQVGAGNSAALTSTFVITNNTCSGHGNGNIQCFPNTNAVVDLTVSGNRLNGPTVTPGGSFPNGVQVGSSGASQVTVTIDNQNIISGHSNQGVNLFASDTSSITAIVDGNTISANSTTSPTTAINAGGNTIGAPIDSSYTITNNVCTGHTNGAIQSFPSQGHHCDLIITGNTITSGNGIASSSPIGIQVGGNNNSIINNPTISNNTWTSSQTYDTSGTPQGISIGISNSSAMSNVVINNNTLNVAVTTYQSGTGPTGIQTYANDTSTMSGLSVTNNRITFISSNYANNTGPNGISVSAGGTCPLTGVAISNNTVTFAPQLTPFANFQQGGIGLSGSDTSTVGTALAPAIISNNTITGVEGNAITLFDASTNDLYMNVSNNTISLGTVQQNEIGVVTVPFATGKLITVIEGNTIEGNNGAFAGIVLTNQSSVCQSGTVQNNTVTNCLGINPSLPIPGLGGGMGAAILGTGNLNVIFNNNGVSGNTPQGIFGLDSQAFGGSGTMCIQLQNNHGAGALPPDNYAFYNPTMAPATTFNYNFGTGNLGTLMFVPSASDFNDLGGPCPTCP